MNHRDNPPPRCQCCGGNGMHFRQAFAAGRSPADRDADCTTCNGTGESWFTARPNSCSGYANLRRGM